MLLPLWPVHSPGEGPSRPGIGPVGWGKPLGEEPRMSNGAALRGKEASSLDRRRLMN